MGRSQELLEAARNGDKRPFEKLLTQINKRSGPFTSLRRGAGINVQDESGYTPLHHACLREHKEIVQLLLSVDASPCATDKTGTTPLHLAAWKGNSEVVAMLLAHTSMPVKIDYQTAHKETALLMAAQFGHVDVVAQLLQAGADVGLRNNHEESALDLAAQFGRLDTVRLLLRARPDLVDPYKAPICKGKMFSSTPLHRASKNGHEKVVLSLLEAGIDPNIKTYHGTPLHEAACHGKDSVVRILLDNKADLNALDRRGKNVHDLLADFPHERVRRVIREYEMRSNYESEEDVPPFPVQDFSPTSYPSVPLAAPETHKNTNKISSFMFPSSSSLTKNQPQSFVKKLANKLGLKSRFSSAPNISNSSGLESEVTVKSKPPDQKVNTNTLHIGNSKFFKLLSKKNESGEIICNDEFDTISLDRLGTTLSRDSTVNRSNRSCPGFKTSLPNISEHNELNGSLESIPKSIVITEETMSQLESEVEVRVTEAINHKTIEDAEESQSIVNDKLVDNSHHSNDSTVQFNDFYEAYEFPNKLEEITPKPVERPNVPARKVNNDCVIYENVLLKKKTIPKPAVRTHVPQKQNLDEMNSKTEKENVCDQPPIPLERSIVIIDQQKVDPDNVSLSSNDSSSSTLSTDSMVDQSYLEDILLSVKSGTFKRVSNTSQSQVPVKADVTRTQSFASDVSDVTHASALEHVDCSGDGNEKELYLSMTGTLPNKKQKPTLRKKVLFRHKTFTNIEIDRNSFQVKDFPKWDADFMKETLPHYHIRGTGHCMYNAPTVEEFIYVFNRDTLFKDVEPFTKIPNNNRDSYFETAICFCKPKPPKRHNSAEDLLEIPYTDEEEKVTIDLDLLQNSYEMAKTSFQCYCDLPNCVYQYKKREKTPNHFVIRFSSVKKSISTPDITLDYFPSSTAARTLLPKNKSFATNSVSPYAISDISGILRSDRLDFKNEFKPSAPIYESFAPSAPIYEYTAMSKTSTLSSASQSYSVKDIADVISLNNSVSTDSSLASDTHLSLRKSNASEYSGHWSLHTCNSNVTVKSDTSFQTCIEESSDDNSDETPSDDDSDAETIKSEIGSSKRQGWVHTDSFRFNAQKGQVHVKNVIKEEDESSYDKKDPKIESGISVGSSSESDESISKGEAELSLGVASLERCSGVAGGVRSGSGRRRWDEAEGMSEGDALSVSSAASSCALHHLAHHHEYNKVSPTPPKKPPRRNLSVSPTHANSPSSGYSYDLRVHARSQDDLDDIQGAKHYLKHGRSIDQYVDGKHSYSEYPEDGCSSPRVAPVPNPRPSLRNRTPPVAITAMYENVVIKEQNPKRKLRRNKDPNECDRMDVRRKYSNQERSSLESLLDDPSMNSPSDGDRYYDGHRVEIPLSPTHYEQPPTPDHPPPTARQAENSIHEKIRPLSQLIMEVVEEIRIRKKSQIFISEHT